MQETDPVQRQINPGKFRGPELPSLVLRARCEGTTLNKIFGFTPATSYLCRNGQVHEPLCTSGLSPIRQGEQQVVWNIGLTNVSSIEQYGTKNSTNVSYYCHDYAVLQLKIQRTHHKIDDAVIQLIQEKKVPQ